MNSIQDTIISFFKKHLITIMGFFVFCTIITISITIPLLEKPLLRVTFLNVGQGDAILIQAPNGRELLIDTGPDQSVVEQIGKQLSFFDNTIDMVLITHPHTDHIGGLPYLFDRYKIPLIIESNKMLSSTTQRVVEEKIINEHSNRLTARNGERIILDPKYGIVVDILFPDQNTNNWEENESSVVVKVSYRNTSLILTGDAPSEVENYLVKTYGNQLHANILKLGHHGSKTSSSYSFVQTINPDIVIVSAGLGNKYGHPHKETINTVESLGATILETAIIGNIQCVSNGITIGCQ